MSNSIPTHHAPKGTALLSPWLEARGFTGRPDKPPIMATIGNFIHSDMLIYYDDHGTYINGPLIVTFMHHDPLPLMRVPWPLISLEK